MPRATASDSGVKCYLFTTVDCPIANGYSPEIRSIAKDYGDSVTLSLVYVDPDLTSEDVARHRKAFNLEALPFMVDRRHELAHKFGITKTPEAAVVLPDETLAYRGAISDWYAGYGKKRAEARNHWLRDALEAVISGDPIGVSRTEAIGCFLPTLPN
jgi:hypothetical protein